MAVYSYVRDKNGNVCGIWLEYPNMLDREGSVEAFLIRDNCLHLLDDYLGKRYRKVPDKTGGCFVLFGDAEAPDVSTKKRWFQFWK